MSSRRRKALTRGIRLRLERERFASECAGKIVPVAVPDRLTMHEKLEALVASGIPREFAKRELERASKPRKGITGAQTGSAPQRLKPIPAINPDRIRVRRSPIREALVTRHADKGENLVLETSDGMQEGRRLPDGTIGATRQVALVCYARTTHKGIKRLERFLSHWQIPYEHPEGFLDVYVCYVGEGYDWLEERLRTHPSVLRSERSFRGDVASRAQGQTRKA